MPYDFNTALERLEKNLQDLDSARKQVEKIVKANTDLQSVVSEYVSSVKKLCSGLQAFEVNLRTQGESLSHEYEVAISRVNSTCTEINKSFGVFVEQTTSDFKNKTESIVENFSEQNRILTERVQNLNTLKDEINKTTSEIQVIKESLAQIFKELKDSQENQNAVLVNIKQDISVLNETVRNAEKNISQEISQTEQDLSATIKQTNSKIDNITTKSDVLATNIADLTTLCQNFDKNITATIKDLNTSIRDIKDDITKGMSETKEEIKKTGNVNKLIVIVGFIIIAILQYLFK